MTIHAGTPAAQRLERVLELIYTERERQEEHRAAGRFEFTCADPSPLALSLAEKLAILMEEVGEVAQEVLTQEGRRLARDTVGTRKALLREVLQVAAVATAWAESLLDVLDE